MEWFEPLIIVAVVAFVVTIFSIHLYRKKKGKGGCSCCSGKSTSDKCSCPCCHMNKETK